MVNLRINVFVLEYLTIYLRSHLMTYENMENMRIYWEHTRIYLKTYENRFGNRWGLYENKFGNTRNYIWQRIRELYENCVSDNYMYGNYMSEHI